ncbi:DUF4870 domain-containing protein [Candidatus Nitrotoga sp. M5]|uniref:DUF4870 domain-containing protein n=1 Tax=Candidatus Nitrotoga sp. M5 TaxID=2890409 RepID=UPI001EF28333|nr:hypothetical protein [Candidatus Nitrotoga sp. M5]CAH1385332.1 conserved membrane hypothetical protein [Candidatus Nitrotoga sp. M5]
MNKTSMGLDEHIACFLCYLFGWLSGLIIFFIEKENALVRFHAAQSVVVFGAISLIQIIFGFEYFFGKFIHQLTYIAALGLWIYLLVKAWKKTYFRIPIASDIAEQLVAKIKI